MRITVACSPDADDLFMVRALLDGLIDTGPYTFAIDTAPTDALNQLANGDGPDVCAISIAHYPAVAPYYQLLPHSGSLGEGYGPVVVAAQPMSLDDLAGKRVAVPGLTTTAYTTLRMMIDVEPVVVPISPYARIFQALRAGEADAGLIIHEGRLTYEDEGFVKVVDIGEWWQAEEALPLPLGGACIKRTLGEHIPAVSALLKEGIRHGLEHRDEAVDWLLSRDGPLKTRAKVSEYLGMYANQRTLDYGEAGRQGVQRFLDRAAQQGLIAAARVDWSP